MDQGTPTIEQYAVEWSANGTDNWTAFPDSPIDVNTESSQQAYIDASSSLTEGTVRYYRIKALSATGTSAYSDPALGATLLETPTGVSANAVSGHQINVAWTDHSAVETGYSVQQLVDEESGDWEEVQWVPTDPGVATAPLTASVEGTFGE